MAASRATLFAAMVVLNLWGILPAVAVAEPAADNGQWTLIYERNLSDRQTFAEWMPILGEWEWMAEGLQKKGADNDGLILLRLPVVSGAVKIEYKARAVRHGDLSLFLGLRAGDLRGAAFFGIGADNNSINRLTLDRRCVASSTRLLPASNAWHTVTVIREGGRLSCLLDGREILSGADVPDGYPGPYIGLYSWNPAQFREIRIWRAADEQLEKYLTPAARVHERRRAQEPAFNFWDYTQQVDRDLRAERSGLNSALAGLGATPRAFDGTEGASGCSAALGLDGALAILTWRSVSAAQKATLQLIIMDKGAPAAAPLPLPDSPAAEGEGGLLVTRSGAMLASWSADPLNGPSGNWLCRSDDRGTTWSVWSEIEAGAAHGPIQLRDGRLLYLGRAREGGTRHVRLLESSNEGRTWRRIWTRDISLCRDVRLYGATLVELDENRWLAMLSYNQGGWDAQLWQMESYDGGFKWSIPRVTPVYGTHPHLLRLDNGLLLCSYSYPRPPYGRRACVSEDDGRHWNIERELVLTADAPDSDSGYPRSMPAASGEITTVYVQASQKREDRLFFPYVYSLPRVMTQTWPLPPWFNHQAKPSMAKAADALKGRVEVKIRDVKLTLDTLRTTRKTAAQRKRRIIMNNDGNDSQATTPQIFLDQRTSGLIGSQVDSIFYCTGINNLYSHPSFENELMGVQPLLDQGTDSLREMVRFAERHHLELFWSMRMNDNHDAYTPVIWSHWKKTRPDLLMSTLDEGPSIWSTLNYGRAEVRQKAVRTIRDVVFRYDVDGIELDFFRDLLYFKEGFGKGPVREVNISLVTDMVRRIRGVTEEEGLRRGRPLLIAVRVPDSPAAARYVGLDIDRWLADDLIDIVTGSGLFLTDPTWRALADLGRKHKAPVYACLSTLRLGDPTRERELWRGEALKAWEAGVAGIYTFNLFDPHDIFFRELGDPEVLRTLPARYDYKPGALGWIDQ